MSSAITPTVGTQSVAVLYSSETGGYVSDTGGLSIIYGTVFKESKIEVLFIYGSEYGTNF